MTITGITSSGFVYEIEKRTLEDRSTLKCIRDVIDASNPVRQTIATYDLPIVLLGEEQAGSLEKHVRDMNDGYCPNESITAEVMEIFNGNKNLKNL